MTTAIWAVQNTVRRYASWTREGPVLYTARSSPTHLRPPVKYVWSVTEWRETTRFGFPYSSTWVHEVIWFSSKDYNVPNYKNCNIVTPPKVPQKTTQNNWFGFPTEWAKERRHGEVSLTLSLIILPLCLKGRCTDVWHFWKSLQRTTI